jgi:60 kDa SS-A/Ro ribonucleoprotein
VQCVDVAALVAASVLRKNQSATVLPFEQAVVPVDLNSRDSVMTNAGRLASIGGGGTNCSARFVF